MVEVKEVEIFLRSYEDWPAWIEAYERRQPLSIKRFVDINAEGPDLVEPVVVTREDYLARLNNEAFDNYWNDERFPVDKGPPPEPATTLTADQTADLRAIQDTARLQLQLYSARVTKCTALNDWINRAVDRSWLRPLEEFGSWLRHCGMPLLDRSLRRLDEQVSGTTSRLQPSPV